MTVDDLLRGFRAVHERTGQRPGRFVGDRATCAQLLADLDTRPEIATEIAGLKFWCADDLPYATRYLLEPGGEVGSAIRFNRPTWRGERE